MRCPVPSCSNPSTGFGVRAALGGGVHMGLDFPVPINTPVRAPDRGVVRSVWWNAGGGRMVAITHDDRLETRFAHLTRATVKRGDVVAAGDLIAFSGATGALVTGPHLHFEVWRDGLAVDPAPWLTGGAGNTTPARICVRTPRDPSTGLATGGQVETMPAPASGVCPAGWIGPYNDAQGILGPDVADALRDPLGAALGAATAELVPVLANVALLGASALIAWGGIRRVLDG